MRQNFFQKIMGSLVGSLFGLGLFLLAFGVIWWNEGKTNLADVARTSLSVSAEQIDSVNDGKLVAVTAPLAAGAPIGDPDFVEPGNFLVLERVAEMYAWDESSGENENSKKYEQKWTTSPADSSKFKVVDGHANPAMKVKENRNVATGGTIGSFGVDLANLSLPSEDRIPAESVAWVDSLKGEIYDDDFYLAPANPDQPKVGDIRISYNALPNPLNVTLFGQQTGKQLISAPYDNGKNTFYRAIEGDRNQAISTLETENTMLTWAMRVGSFLMMWLGLSIFFSPLVDMLGILPVLKQIGSFLSGVVTFVITLVLWLLATLVAIVLQNLWLLIAVVVIVIAGAYFLVSRRQQVGQPSH